MPRTRKPPPAEVTVEDATAPASFSDARTTETEVIIASPPSGPGRPVLTLLSGVNAGEVFVVDSVGELIIGRARDAEVRIDAVGVSRRHARLSRTGAGAQTIVIEDLGSTNGIYVNGARVRRAELTPGDQLQIGSEVILRLSLIDAAEEALSRQLFESSTRDALTGAYNRRYFMGRLEAEVAYALRHDVKLGLIIFDLDHFKTINDAHGHVAGDAMLRAVGLVVARLLRSEDVFARYGGEEFAVIVRGIAAESVARLAERVRKAVAGVRVPWGDGALQITVSLGLGLLSEQDGVVGSGLIELADTRLYRAKARGRDCVVAG